MALERTNNEVMSRDFSTISAEAFLKEAYNALKKNLEGPPHAPGLVVLDSKGKYAGVLTVDDFMR
jgi:CBS domain-containing protein